MLRRRVWLVVSAFALIVAAGFAVMVLEVVSLRGIHAEAHKATRMRSTGDSLAIALLSLQTGSRGYILTGDRSLLGSWERGRRQLRSATTGLAGLDLNGDEAALARSLAEGGRQYLHGWSEPLVLLAERDREAAARRVATHRGERAVARLRAQLRALEGAAARAAASRERQAHQEMSAAIAAGGVSLLGSLVLAILLVLYLDRSVLEPVRTAAAAATRLGRGDLAARVEAEGHGEVAELGHAFNRMATELADEIELRTAVCDAVVDGICVTDLDGRVLFWNSRMQAFVDELEIPTQGSIFARIGSLADRFTEPESYAEAMARIQQGQGETSNEFTMVDSGRSFRGFTGPVRDSGGAVVARIFTLRETTAERQSERLKDEFVANVSHELRTPLTSILGYLDLAFEEPGLGEGPRAHLAVARRNADRLLRLVGDLLFVTTVEAGAFRLQLEPVDVGALASRAVEASAPLAARRGIALELDRAAMPLVEADPLRLAQLIDNLLSNALKFTPRGGRVGVRVRETAGSVELAVADTGPGIPEEDREGLFARFARGERAQRESVPGAGLGLAIVRAIARAHGGEVRITDEPGWETTVTVRLPIGRAARAAA